MGNIISNPDPFGDNSGISLWQFEGNAYDTSGRHNGVWHGTEQYDVGIFGQAAKFDGNSYIDFGNISEFNTSQSFSISLWIYTPNKHYSYGQVFSRGLTHIVEIEIENGGKTHFWVEDGSDVDRFIQTANPIEEKKWAHIVAIYDGRYIKLYLNGALQDSLDINGFNIYYNSEDSVFIGKGDGGNIGSGVLIDQVRIFNRDLTEEEVLILYQNKKTSGSFARSNIF